MIAAGSAQTPLVFLKARATPVQLADRLAPPVPDGVELYVHEQDVSAPGWLEKIVACIRGAGAPAGFQWVVEGPVWSLDGELFGLARGAEADRELTRRLVRLAEAIHAPALNIHCVEGSPDPGVLDEAHRRDALERAVPFLEWYVHLCQDAGVLPLIENVPPICRMRRSAFVYTPLGVEPNDLAECVRAAPGLRLTLDTSHAQLAVNAFRGVPAEAQIEEAADYYRRRGGPQTLEAYVAPLLDHVVGAHVSNAAGLLDEGLPYEQGDADLDAAVRQLAPHVRYFVTEPLDPDDDHAVLKREVQRHILAALGRSAAAAERAPAGECA